MKNKNAMISGEDGERLPDGTFIAQLAPILMEAEEYVFAFRLKDGRLSFMGGSNQFGRTQKIHALKIAQLLTEIAIVAREKAAEFQ